MNLLLAENADLEMWEGWVGDTHSVAATWNRHKNKAQCGFQLFSTWNGEFTLMLLYNDTWVTPVHKIKDSHSVRKILMRYMSEQIEKINSHHAYSQTIEKSFKDAHTQLNLWMNEQVKIVKWFKQHR